MFTTYPTYDRYRTLRLTNPLMRGEDVYALQTALTALGGTAHPGAADGVLGQRTASAIVHAQRTLAITADGLAGAQTQIALTRQLADATRTRHRLPIGLAFGQLSHESSCRVGNYSPRRDDGSYDAGVAQRNTSFTKPEEAFAVPSSIDALGARLRTYFDKFAGLPERRRWTLAAGAWNAPAYASWIARDEGATAVRASETSKPSVAARATLERYMTSATAHLTL